MLPFPPSKTMLPTLLQKRCILLLHDFHWKLCKLSTRKVIFVLCSNCLGLPKRKEKRLAKQSGLQSRKQRQTSFAQRGQVAPNTRTGLCARPRAEAAGDLLLHFGPAQVALSLVVVKRHTQIFQKRPHRLLVGVQPIQQIARAALFDATAVTGRSLSTWMDHLCLSEQGQETCLPIRPFQGIQPE